jgi:hypothetical protein
MKPGWYRNSAALTAMTLLLDFPRHQGDAAQYFVVACLGDDRE